MRVRSRTILVDGRQLFTWWANNKGRGTDNCSLAIVPAGVIRANYSAQQTEVIFATRTSSWGIDVNLSKRVLAKLGITKCDLCSDKLVRIVGDCTTCKPKIQGGNNDSATTV